MGNIETISYKGRTLVWRGRRLISYGKSAKRATYTYDANSVRTSKTVTDGINTLTSEFIYDGNNLIAERREGKWIYYLYGVDGIAGFRYEGVTYLYRKNIQGDITHIYDIRADGSLIQVAHYAYDAFGNVKELQENSAISKLNPFRYRGYYYDSETKLYYLISRYYDPETGRFISADGIEYLDPETLGGLNLYAYCGNNPVMNVDPTGKIAFFIGLLLFVLGCGVAGATVGGISAAVHHENIWDGIWKGTLVGLMFGGSLALIATGVGTAAAGTIWGSMLVGAGVGSAFALGTNLDSQLKNGGFGSLSMGSLASSWGIGLGVGAVAGAVSYCATQIGAYIGEMLGFSLLESTFWGLEISKIISIEFLADACSLIGGALAGFVVGLIVNNSATNSGVQNKNIPFWIGTIIKLIFGKK